MNIPFHHPSDIESDVFGHVVIQIFDAWSAFSHSKTIFLAISPVDEASIPESWQNKAKSNPTRNKVEAPTCNSRHPVKKPVEDSFQPGVEHCQNPTAFILSTP